MAKPHILRKPALGIDQLSDETSLRTNIEQKITSIREGTNIDIDVEGNVSRRDGYDKLIAGEGYHSLYESERGWLMLCHKDELGVYNTETNSLAVLVSLDESYRTSFAEMNGNLYYVNPGSKGMIRKEETQVRTLGVHLPEVTPGFAVVANGGLTAGTYGITYAIVDDTGEESPLGPLMILELPDGGAIQGTLFTLYPNTKYRIYMTSADGVELYQVAEFDADTVSHTVMTFVEGRRPDTQFLSNLPYGYILAAHGSRLYVATNDFVFFSEAFLPHLTNEANGFVPTTGFTTMVQPVGGGIYIGDQTGVRFYKGEDPTEFVVEDVSSEVAVFGTSIAVPGEYLPVDLGKGESAAVWLAQSGYHIGLPSGEVVRLHSDQVQLPRYVQGCTAFFIQDGRKQIVTPVNSNVLADASVALDSTIS